MKCKKCKGMITLNMKECPACGETNELYMSQKKQAGCLLLIIIPIIIAAIAQANKSEVSTETKANQKRLTEVSLKDTQSKWYIGGTLHKAGALEWQKGTYSNKLATCADFINKLNQDGALVKPISSKINSVDDSRPFAEELVKALDEAFKKDSNPAKNKQLYANQTVAGTVPILLVYMKWLK